MSVIHDGAMSPWSTSGDVVEWLDASAIELRIPAVSAFPWPTEVRLVAPRFAQRLTALFYKLATPQIELPWLSNFGELSERLSRGAQPGRAGFVRLRNEGIDTIINLRLESTDEAPIVRSLGMRYLYCPMDPLAAPSHAQTLAFLHMVTDPGIGRVFFHCYHGADRTGVLAACYRIAHDGWSLERAVAELRAFRFNQSFQRPKLNYLKQFDTYWHALPADEQASILRRS